MKTAICHYSYHRTWKAEKWSCLKLAETIKSLGADGIDFHARLLGTREGKIEEINQALKATGLILSGLSLSNNFNMEDPEGYAKLISIAEPHFIEVKAYMFVGASRLKLSMENMPRHPEVKEFAEQIAKASGYKIIDEHEASRVVLLMKEDSQEPRMIGLKDVGS